MNKELEYQKIINYIKDDISQNKKLKYLTLLCEIPNLFKESFPYMNWIGFYLADKNDNHLYLGPYVGSEACEIIPFTNGVCGKAYTEKMTQIVNDVHSLTYHIACSSSTNSEIVVPIIVGDECLAVFDIDSDDFSAFDDTDKKYIEEICLLLSQLY